jgi:hypothetical protein
MARERAIDPRSSGLICPAMSAIDSSVRWRTPSSRIVHMAFIAETLTAGVNLQNNVVARDFWTNRGRKQESDSG